MIAILASLPFLVFACMMVRAEWNPAPKEPPEPVADPQEPRDVSGWVAPPPWAYGNR